LVSILLPLKKGIQMTLSILKARSSHCELCNSTDSLVVYEIPSSPKTGADAAVLLCGTCQNALNTDDFSNINHWRCLNEAIWNENVPVKVLAYQILHKLRSEPWAQELIEQVYLEEDQLAWAKSGINDESSGAQKPTKDSNGTILQEGDSVTLIKDLEVKGAGFTAKRGTLVKNIRLTENPEHIEGRVNGIAIVLVANFLKKVIA
jgi:protein PhnA